MNDRTVAYFTMEIGVDPAIPTYAGGLGVLAGDTVRSAADLEVPMLAVTLLHRKGYFRQSFDSSGWQRESAVDWKVDALLTEMPQRARVQIEGRTVHLRAWRYEVTGISGFVVPVYFLDVDLPENAPWDRTLTDFLYGGDAYYRICQEVILGIGGVRMIRALDHHAVHRFHMNEGHASLLTLELLDLSAADHGRSHFNHDDVERVRERCVFTTHTPVPAGHDQFPLELAGRILGRDDLGESNEVFCCEGVINLTHVALNLSHYVNGVAKKHAEVSRRMFAKYRIDDITNGVHAATWTAPSFQQLFDREIPGWRADNFSLRYAHNLPAEDVWTAHAAAKSALFERVLGQARAVLDPNVLTLGFARRATAYKRADLLFSDVDRLKKIAGGEHGLQLVFGGKAHPNDSGGKEIIQRILRTADALQPEIKLVYLDNYDVALAKLVTSGVDVWLNTPLPPMEASGTSGMKAALNGVPSLSVYDGWWLEGCVEGATGWAIGQRPAAGETPNHDRDRRDADSLYEKLEHTIIPLYYRERNQFVRIMRHAIALNGAFFNTQRMVQQYVLKAYFE